MNQWSVLLAVYVAINVFAVATMGRDKYKSKRDNHSKRAPEGYLFFLASIGGSVGVYVGMYAFRHKTKKWYFKIGIPLLVMQNLASLYTISLYVGQW